MGNRWLLAAGGLSALAAVVHVVIIWGGPDYYRFFGAGEAMARAAARGSARPGLITAAIATILFLWSLYAFSGAGLIRRLPLLRPALVLITLVYLARAMAPLPLLVLRPWLLTPFLLWSSLIVLVYGLAYGIGTWRAWPGLRRSGHR